MQTNRTLPADGSRRDDGIRNMRERRLAHVREPPIRSFAWLIEPKPNATAENGRHFGLVGILHAQRYGIGRRIPN